MSVSKLLQRMQQAAEKAADTMVEGIKEKITVPADVKEARWNICANCDKLYKPTNSCKLCGCFMKAKINLPSAECPIKKWEAYTPTDAEKS